MLFFINKDDYYEVILLVFQTAFISNLNIFIAPKYLVTENKDSTALRYKYQFISVKKYNFNAEFIHS
jgi:hypothetical protein